MINLYSAVLQNEMAIWQLHGATKEEVLSWKPLSGINSECIQELQGYFSVARWSSSMITTCQRLGGPEDTLRITQSAYRAEATWDEFAISFKPIGSKSKEGDIGIGTSSNGSDMVHYGLETYGDDLKLVQQFAESGCVATVIDNDSGGHSLIGGMHAYSSPA